MTTYESLGLRPIINAAGTMTRLGGSRMPGEVLAVMAETARSFVPMEMLLAATSRRIADATGAEAGLVTCGAAAALTLGTAACIAGLDTCIMDRLPDTSGLERRQVVVARSHCTGYERAVQAAGAELIVIDTDRNDTRGYEHALTSRTAAILYSAGMPGPNLDRVCGIAHERAIPVVVDAAAELPPRENLRLFVSDGADLVAFSGGKGLRGPQNSGILAGRRELIASAAMQNLDMDVDRELWRPPSDFIDESDFETLPRQGVGRGLKVSKETVIGLMTALNRFLTLDHDEERRRLAAATDRIAAALVELPCCAIDEGSASWIVKVELSRETRPPVHLITLTWSDPGHGQSTGTERARQLIDRLREGNPSVHVDEHRWRRGQVAINPLCILDEEIRPLCRSLASVLAAGA